MWSSRARESQVYALKADFFRVLKHPVRVRILQLLRGGERSVGELRDELELESSGTSQHLAALRAQGFVAGRKEGTTVYYRVKDPRTIELLQLAKEIISSSLEEKRVLLDDLAEEDFGPRRDRG
jgi:DNA-binding transcriptional ArsR family regulator